ncbi:MAG: hypothetical protein H6658_12360 [Ardenticatenaceae bacterium]|nr:hypothetical protein [Ardenticatenaceae bacterium]
MKDGYTHLYFTLIAELKHQHIWDSVSKFLAGFIGLSWLVAFLVVILLRGQPRFILILQLGIALTFFWLFVGLVYWLFYLAWAGSRNPANDVSKLAARLLVAVERPYRRQRGLSYDDLSRMQQIAELEQGSADWRGNFFNLIIVGVLLGVVATILEPPQALNRLRDLLQKAGETPINMQVSPTLLTMPTWIEIVLNLAGAIIALFLSLRLLRQLFSYVDLFLATETANRTVLFACAEAKSLLEQFHIHEKRTYSLAEKKGMARHLGYRLRVRQDYSVPLFEDKDGDWWHLDDVNQMPTIERKRRLWHTLRRRLGLRS